MYLQSTATTDGQDKLAASISCMKQVVINKIDIPLLLSAEQGPTPE